MKQAFLIIAHDNFEHLKHLIQSLDHNDSLFFVHIDAKAKIPSEILTLRTINPISIFQKYKVKWGSQSQIKTELFLFENAFNNHDIEWFHLLSGVDFPLTNNDKIIQFFKYHSGIDAFLESESPLHIYDRIRLYHFYVSSPDSANRFKKFLQRKFNALQIRIGVNRLKNNVLKIGYGSNWGDFRRNAVMYLLSKKKEILKFTKFTACADEIYKQTFLSDSNIKICPDNLRYIDWSAKGTSSASA